MEGDGGGGGVMKCVRGTVGGGTYTIFFCQVWMTNVNALNDFEFFFFFLACDSVNSNRCTTLKSQVRCKREEGKPESGGWPLGWRSIYV